MPQRIRVVGPRSVVMWLLIIIAVVAVIALVTGGLVVYPRFQEQQAAIQTIEATLAVEDSTPATPENATATVTSTPPTPVVIVVTATPEPATETPRSPQCQIAHMEYLSEMLDVRVADNELLCLTTGPIVVEGIQERLEFQGYRRASAVCWIGAQQAEAKGLTGSSLKEIDILHGDPEQIAVTLVRQWGHDMTTRSDGCGDYGPCDVADLAIVRTDGTVIRPTVNHPGSSQELCQPSE